METLKKIYERFKQLDKKKRMYFISIFAVIFVMAWAFISAGLITANFNRAQVKGNQDEQKVDAVGIIITETNTTESGIRTSVTVKAAIRIVVVHITKVNGRMTRRMEKASLLLSEH